MAQETKVSVRKVRGLGTLYRRTKTDPDGTVRELPHWHFQFSHNGQQVRESAQTDNYNKAVSQLKIRHAEIVSGKFIGLSAERIHMAQLLQDVLDDYKTYHQGSLRFASPIITRLTEALGAMRAISVKVPVIRDYIKTRMKDSPAPAPATINHELGMLRRAFNLAKANGKLNAAHIPDFTGLFFETHNARQGFYEHADYLKMRDALPADEQAVFIAGYYTLMRYTALTELRWDWVDLERAVIRIPPGIIKNKDPLAIHTGGPGTELHDMLVTRKALRDAKFPATPWVFFRSEHRRGLPVKLIGQKVRARHQMDTARKKLGLEGRLFHDLRRTGARNMRKAGVPEGVIMKAGAWKTASVFRRYDIKDEGDLERAAQALHQFVQKQGQQK